MLLQAVLKGYKARGSWVYAFLVAPKSWKREYLDCSNCIIFISQIRPLGRHVLAQELNFPVSKPVLLSVVIDTLISKQYQLSIQHLSLKSFRYHHLVLTGSL